MSIITYHIVSDQYGALRSSAKQACDFWNRYVRPFNPIVVRLGTFTSDGRVIARAYEPYKRDGTVYGVIEFNTQFIDNFDRFEITSTLIHEIGHTLGIGWGKWMSLFSKKTGDFYKSSIAKVPELKKMKVELDYDRGTKLSHWDEKLFDKELMTGIKDNDEAVLPVTIDVMTLLDHEVKEKLSKKRSLREILNEMEKMVFSRMEEVTPLKRDVFIETGLWEEVYSPNRIPIDALPPFSLD